MRDHNELQGLLDEFVDGALASAEEAEVGRHLEQCAECREDVEAVRVLQAEARALPREIAPSRDLWPEIAARLRTAPPAPPRVAVIDLQARRAERGRWREWGWRAAAAVALVALSSGGTAYLLEQRAPAPTATVAYPVVESRAVGLAAFQPAEREYLDAVEALQVELAARREQLSPETVAAVESSLRIIDQAIAEARAALAADPSNPELPHLLRGVYHRKVELLQQVTQLPART